MGTRVYRRRGWCSRALGAYSSWGYHVLEHSIQRLHQGGFRKHCPSPPCHDRSGRPLGKARAIARKSVRQSPVRCIAELRLGLQPQAERLTLPNSSVTIKTDASEDDMVCSLILLDLSLSAPLVFTSHAGRTKNCSDKPNEGASD